MKITNTMLKQAKACEEQGNLFKELFPRGVTLTEELCVKHCMDFDWLWAANNLLPEAQRKEYKRQRASLLEEYLRQQKPLWAEYEKQCAVLFYNLSKDL